MKNKKQFYFGKPLSAELELPHEKCCAALHDQLLARSCTDRTFSARSRTCPLDAGSSGIPSGWSGGMGMGLPLLYGMGMGLPYVMVWDGPTMIFAI